MTNKSNTLLQYWEYSVICLNHGKTEKLEITKYLFSKLCLQFNYIQFSYLKKILNDTEIYCTIKNLEQ